MQQSTDLSSSGQLDEAKAISLFSRHGYFFGYIFNNFAFLTSEIVLLSIISLRMVEL